VVAEEVLPMNATVSSIRGRIRREPAAVMVGVSVAAIANAYTLGVGMSPGPRYLLASLIAAVPVAFLLISAVERWPYSVALGLIGLLMFSLMLAAAVRLAAQPDEPLIIALVFTLLIGAELVARGLTRWTNVYAGLMLAYICAFFLFEASLHLWI
jgi:hypothetical protein